MDKSGCGSGSGNGFVRADQIDLKSLDEQLERHLNRAWTMDKNKKKNQDDFVPSSASVPSVSVAPVPAPPRRKQQEWEIDPSKLLIKGVLARGTFGTVHRGIYDGQDVAGESLFSVQSPHHPPFLLFLFCCHFLNGPHHCRLSEFSLFP